MLTHLEATAAMETLALTSLTLVKLMLKSS